MPTDQILATEEMVGAGHGTKADTLNRFLNKLTTAGDIPYATAAQTVARLGIGTANFKLFTNAGATAPEWAAGMEVITTTYDLSTVSGNKAITGFGFKPAMVLLIGGVGSSVMFSIGVAYAAKNYVMTGFYDGNIQVYNHLGCILIATAVGTYVSGSVGSWDSDGITLTMTKVLSPTGTLTFHAIGWR